jgi:hypothetical protein
MIDHRIILSILYHTTHETQVEDDENKRACACTDSFIFFPFLKKGYYEKLIRLNTRQYLQRLNILCPVLGRIN